MLDHLQCEDIESSRRKQGKRQLAVYNTCKIELKSEIQLLFKVFADALDNANKALSMFPIQSRSRTLEASIIQSCFAEKLLKEFEDKAFYGKYKRLILHVNGYFILFKKLNKKGHPMNIKTTNVQSILDQTQTCDLFADTAYNEDPILYFGYQKNKFGDYVSPQVVYIDEGQVRFTIGVSDMQLELPIIRTETASSNKVADVMPKLKQDQQFKKAN